MSANPIILTNDPAAVAQINSEKVLVAVPLLYAFLVILFQFRPITYSKVSALSNKNIIRQKD